MNVPGEDGDFARRIVQVHAHHGEPAGRYRAVAEVDADVLVLRVALNFEVTKAAVEGQLGIHGRTLLPEARQSDGAVGRHPGDASVFELNLGTSIV